MIHILLTHVGGAHYEDTVRLRQRVLRDPLGLVLDTSGDGARTFFVAVEDGVVVGTVALEENRLRAMAVEGETRGIGRLLVARLEQEALARGITRIELHARITARGFYAKLGYTEHGEEFTEVTVPHIAMAKDLG